MDFFQALIFIIFLLIAVFNFYFWSKIQRIASKYWNWREDIMGRRIWEKLTE